MKYEDVSLDGYSMELYIGEKRSGKTLSLVADTYKDLLKLNRSDIKIYSNFHLNKKYFKNVHLITQDDLAGYYEKGSEFMNSYFLIDELQKWLDNRNFMKKSNKQIGYFLGQMGKRGNILRGTIHDYNLIDVRGRLYSEKISYIFKGLIDEQEKWKPLLNNNRRLSDEENNRLIIKKITFIKKLVKTRFLPEYKYVKMPPEWIKAIDYFKMYDTQELI